jgi:hypothetical protein
MPDRELTEEMTKADYWEVQADMWHQNYKEAADEIIQLRKDNKLAFELMDTFVKEINRMKQVLRLIANMESDPEFGTLPISEAQKIAQDALEDE